MGLEGDIEEVNEGSKKGSKLFRWLKYTAWTFAGAYAATFLVAGPDRMIAWSNGESYDQYKQRRKEAYIEGKMDHLLKYDLNGDGVIDKEEIRKFAEEQYKNNPLRNLDNR